MNIYEQRLQKLESDFERLVSKLNKKNALGNGIYDRYENPIITANHVPLTWRYDFNLEVNPFLMERFGINATFNAGAIKWQGKFILAIRVEGLDRK